MFSIIYIVFSLFELRTSQLAKILICSFVYNILFFSAWPIQPGQDHFYQALTKKALTRHALLRIKLPRFFLNASKLRSWHTVYTVDITQNTLNSGSKNTPMRRGNCNGASSFSKDLRICVLNASKVLFDTCFKFFV